MQEGLRKFKENNQKGVSKDFEGGGILGSKEENYFWQGFINKPQDGFHESERDFSGTMVKE